MCEPKAYGDPRQGSEQESQGSNEDLVSTSGSPSLGDATSLQEASLPRPLSADCSVPQPACWGPHLQVTEEQGAPVGAGQLHDGVPVNAAVALPPSCKEATACHLYLHGCHRGSTGPSSSFPLSGPQFLTSQCGDSPVLPSFQGSQDHQIRK